MTQPDPTADLERLRAMHDRLLNGYGFHDDYDRATADLGALGRLLARTDGDKVERPCACCGKPSLPTWICDECHKADIDGG